jgi:nucleoside-diphosphate-sugar epimerase
MKKIGSNLHLQLARMKVASVYGSTGFIGNSYCDLYESQVSKIPRDERKPNNKDILYLISTVHNYNIFNEPLLDVNTNLNILIKTLESCRNKYDSNFIFNFISSWFVYGKTQDLPASEDSNCNPKGFYSITKRAAEQMLVSYCETYNINYRILRLGNIYGTNDVKASKKKNAFLYLAQQVVQGKDIQLYNEGKNIRDFLHVSDVCSAINLVINKGKLNEIYNIGSGKPNTFIETMSYVRTKSQSNSRFEFIDPPEFHKVVQVQDMYLNTSKLKELGFEQKISIWKGLDEIIENSK